MLLLRMQHSMPQLQAPEHCCAVSWWRRHVSACCDASPSAAQACRWLTSWAKLANDSGSSSGQVTTPFPLTLAVDVNGHGFNVMSVAVLGGYCVLYKDADVGPAAAAQQPPNALKGPPSHCGLRTGTWLLHARMAVAPPLAHMAPMCERHYVWLWSALRSCSMPGLSCNGALDNSCLAHLSSISCSVTSSPVGVSASVTRMTSLGPL